MIHTKIFPKSNTTDLLKKAMHTASCYGFDNIEKVAIHQKKQDAHTISNIDEKSATTLEKQKRIKQCAKLNSTDTISNEIMCALKTVMDKGLLPSEHPILIHQNNNSSNKSLNFGLVAIGMKKSIAEALIIKTASAILEDMGINGAQVYINSMGDKDSSQKFVNELNLYFRKNINSVPSQIRQSIKRDIFKAYYQLHTKHNPQGEDLPQSIKFLSDNNRKHLSEVLEYLETSNIPYEIDNFLVGNNECYSQTLFEIRNNKISDQDFSVLAKGGRCDELVRRAFNISIPTVGVVFEFEKKGIKEKELEKVRTKKPKAYFIQLGFEAKRRSLPIIDVLRKANVPAYHSLDNDKFGDQLSFARYLGVPYTIIMGHREALDGTVIVRNMDTQFQHTVLVNELPKYLKEIHI